MHENRGEKIKVEYKGGNFMKRILKMILTGILLFCTVFSVVGCGEESGMTEEERIAYENIEKYHAEIVSDYEMNSEYIMANKTKGPTSNSEGNSALPEYRVNVITSQDELNTAFTSFSETDFEEEMIIIYFYTSTNNRRRKLKGITINENQEVCINFITVSPGEGIEDACAPKTRPLIIRMDKVEYSSFTFIER